MRYQITILTLLLVSYGCKKDSPVPVDSEPNVTGEVTTSDYTQLSVGSYWIYARYNVDTNNVETCSTTRDSVIISGDTIIKGNTYSIRQGGFWGLTTTNYLRDSANYLVNEKGEIFFSSTDFVNILHFWEDSLVASISYQMTNPSLPIEVPAGSYSTLDYQGTVLLKPGFTQWGATRYTHVYFSPGVGVVKVSRFAVGNAGSMEWRLVQYHIN